MDNNNNFDSSANTDMIEFHDCEDVVARFGDYVDNDLLRPERLAVEAHINDCPACAARQRLRCCPVAPAPFRRSHETFVACAGY